MKLPIIICTLLFVSLSSSFAYAQSNSAPEYIVMVRTENETFKGRLTSILDSSIEITGSRFNEKKIVAVSSIQMIKIKRPFIKNVTFDFFVGAVLGGAFVVSYYAKKDFYTPGDPPFGRALWTTMAFGASLGIIYGSIESTFIRIRIPIHKTQYIFENKRTRLAKYVSY